MPCLASSPCGLQALPPPHPRAACAVLDADLPIEQLPKMLDQQLWSPVPELGGPTSWRTRVAVAAGARVCTPEMPAVL